MSFAFCGHFVRAGGGRGIAKSLGALADLVQRLVFCFLARLVIFAYWAAFFAALRTLL